MSAGVAAAAANLRPPNASAAAAADEMAKDEYFRALRQWLDQTRLLANVRAQLPHYMMLMGQAGRSQPSVGFAPAAYAGLPTAPNRATDGRPQGERLADIAARYQFGLLRNPWRQVGPTVYADIVRETGGYEYVAAPIWKRLASEFIDFIFIVIFKMILVDLFDLHFFEDVSMFNVDGILNLTEGEYAPEDILAMYTSVIYTEIALKTLICLYETLLCCRTPWHRGRGTPGKFLMGLRVLYAEGVAVLPDTGPQPQPQPARPDSLWSRLNPVPVRLLVYPAGEMSFRRALSRAIMKNVLLLPLWMLVFYRDHRTTYDVATRTLVVDIRAAGNAPRAFRRL